jgi:hypothetical protein
LLTSAQQRDLTAHRDRLNTAEIARRIHGLQLQLTLLLYDKTEQFHLASNPPPP